MDTIDLNINVNLQQLVKAVYDMSVPMGLGQLHYVEGSLSDQDAESLIDMSSDIPIQMDYVKGRCCKMRVFKDEKGFYVKPEWADHTEDQLLDMLNRCGGI
jgi:hypothetical protein|tara:strand:- start:176 stop:478 length:303 start_codon:yes stop_codon:yes gene_type:complete